MYTRNCSLSPILFPFFRTIRPLKFLCKEKLYIGNVETYFLVQISFSCHGFICTFKRTWSVSTRSNHRIQNTQWWVCNIIWEGNPCWIHPNRLVLTKGKYCKEIQSVQGGRGRHKIVWYFCEHAIKVPICSNDHSVWQETTKKIRIVIFNVQNRTLRFFFLDVFTGCSIFLATL